MSSRALQQIVTSWERVNIVGIGKPCKEGADLQKLLEEGADLQMHRTHA